MTTSAPLPPRFILLLRELTALFSADGVYDLFDLVNLIQGLFEANVLVEQTAARLFLSVTFSFKLTFTMTLLTWTLMA